MAYTFIYTARRGLKDGVIAGDEIIFTTSLVDALPSNQKSQRVRQALSGRRRTRILNRTETLSIASPVLTTADAETHWRQLVESLDTGQSFTLNDVVYEMDGTWQAELVNKQNLWWRFRFTAYRVRN